MRASRLTVKDRFEIGGEDALAAAHAEASSTETSRQRSVVSGGPSEEALQDVRVRVGTLLKAETVSLLLGAGASVNCGGQLIGKVPLAVEEILSRKGVSGVQRLRVRRWLTLFYAAVRCCCPGDGPPATRQTVIARREALGRGDAEPLPVNFESVLTLLHRWRAALPEAGGRLRVDGSPRIEATAGQIDDCLREATRALAGTCDLPTADMRTGLTTYETLVRKLLTRPLNLKRVNVFTLNYDTLIEQAADAAGVVLRDGFVGTHRRVFRPESYEQDLYFPAETTEGRVQRFDRVMHLYKLHGSITWTTNVPASDDPYGVQCVGFDPDGLRQLLIYPTPAKAGETLGLPYSELFRRFAVALARPQSVLFVIGYGFGDEHVNSIVRQALAVPSFTLVVVDPSPTSDFVTKLREQQDRRIWIAEGPKLGKLSGFVNYALPDLRDEEIRMKVLATHNALAKSSAAQGGSDSGA